MVFFARIRRYHKWYIVASIFLLALGAFLRFYNRAAAMYYMNDQAQLLLIGHQILSGSSPIAGPSISLASATIPPFTYYFVSVLERFGTSPLAVASWYIGFNVLACIALAYYAYLRYGKKSALFTFAAAMISAALVENGRTIWEPHPTFWFVILYMLLTELAAQNKRIVLYWAGLVSYMVSSALYPTPVLLAPFVLFRTTGQLKQFGKRMKTRAFLYACGLIGSAGLLIFGPWMIRTAGAQTDTVGSLVQLVSSPVSLVRMVGWAYSYMSNAVHDLVRIWSILPSWAIGTVWTRLGALVFVVWVASQYSRTERAWLFRSFVSEGYHWLFIGYFAPAIFGMPMMPHRQFPFYPFFLLWAVLWVQSWSMDTRRVRRVVAYAVAGIYLIGNLSSWYMTTVAAPRNDYPRTMRAADAIKKDIAYRRIASDDIGVHYFRPDDQYDFFAASVYYPLHIDIGLPVYFTPLGNKLDRARRETHAVVYLVCDGFDGTERILGCIQPFQARFPGYEPADQFPITSQESVVVFERQTGRNISPEGYLLYNTRKV